jgi:hypothetical protein
MSLAEVQSRIASGCARVILSRIAAISSVSARARSGPSGGKTGRDRSLSGQSSVLPGSQIAKNPPAKPPFRHFARSRSPLRPAKKPARHDRRRARASAARRCARRTPGLRHRPPLRMPRSCSGRTTCIAGLLGGVNALPWCRARRTATAKSCTNCARHGNLCRLSVHSVVPAHLKRAGMCPEAARRIQRTCSTPVNSLRACPTVAMQRSVGSAPYRVLCSLATDAAGSAASGGIGAAYPAAHVARMYPKRCF